MDVARGLKSNSNARCGSGGRCIHGRTAGNDGFVSLEVSPLLAYDTKSSVAAATTLHKKANRPNLFIKTPKTKEGNPAIEEAIAGGVAINVSRIQTNLPDRFRPRSATFRAQSGWRRRPELAHGPTVAPPLTPEPIPERLKMLARSPTPLIAASRQRSINIGQREHYRSSVQLSLVQPTRLCSHG